MGDLIRQSAEQRWEANYKSNPSYYWKQWRFVDWKMAMRRETLDAARLQVRFQMVIEKIRDGRW